MSTPGPLARLATPLADPARAAMAQALMGGQALMAGELARAAGVTPPTTTAHPARLLDGGLVTVHAEGRQRVFAIADQAAATAREGLMVVAASPRAPCLARGSVRRGSGEGLARRLATITPEGARALRDGLGLAWPPAAP